MNESNNENNVYYVNRTEKISLIELVKQLKKDKPKGKVTIIVEEGNYYCDNSIILDNLGFEVTIKAEGEVRFIGGVKLTEFKKVTDTNILNRLCESVHDKVLQCDLYKNGVKEIGGFASRGFDRPTVLSHSELFIDTIPLNVAQYPKKDQYTLVTGFLQETTNSWGQSVGSLEAGFKYNSERPKTWEKSDDIWVHGYWSWDWANSYERVIELDTQEMTIKTAPPHGNYAFKIGQRFYFINILEEITEPGDYYIDRNSNTLYFYPLKDSIPEEVIISTLGEPLLEIVNSSDIHIEGITFEAMRSHAVKITNSKNILINNCIIRNIGNNGIEIMGGENIKVSSCNIYDVGDGGIYVEAGDRKKLIPANISIHNNHIHNVSKWTRCYRHPINITGIGISATNNLIHNCPHIAIIYWGNDINIENNEIYNVVMETGDAGAIYTGRDYTFRGNRVCKNYIHHLGGVGMGTMGIYNDDCVSGTLMQDNIFYGVSRAVFLGGGRDFLVKNNIFIDCYPAVEIDGRGASKHKVWRRMVDNMMKETFYEIGGNKAPFTDRYPELLDIDRYYTNNEPIPPSAVIENNIFCYIKIFEGPFEKATIRDIFGTKRILEFSFDSEKGKFLIESNYFCGKEDFADLKTSDLRIKQDSSAFHYGFQNIEIQKIGLIEKERRHNPPKVITGLRFDKANNVIILSLDNQRDKHVLGSMSLFIDKEQKSMDKKPIKIELKGFEKKEYQIPLPNYLRKVEIEARSSVAGVRPCKIRI